jgi:hypothetical protein
MPEFKWLPCKVREGMFSDESMIQLVCYGKPCTFFVPVTDVRADNGEHGAVRVHVVADADGFWAVLPNPERTIIPVRETDLLAA